MSAVLARNDSSLLARWWWTVDRWTLAALGLLVALGAVLVAAASPPVAERIGLPAFHFVERHLLFLPPALALMGGISLLSPKGVRRVALLILLAGLAGVAATLVSGQEIKGATRWIRLFGFSLQPSEFVKPAFAVIAAWAFALHRQKPGAPGWQVAIALYVIVAGLLLCQPDFGMTFVVTAVFGAQFFLAGLPLIFVIGGLVLSVSGVVGAYFLFSHVRDRVDSFLDPSAGDNYQVERSLEALRHGGLLGTGPGQGTVKLNLPDAHADFVFSVAGEEFGLVATLLILCLFAFIVLRGLIRVGGSRDLFVLLAGGGLLVQFGLQALIHMGSALKLLPAKGMTLPFISYGGSSMLALGIGVGMMLALTRRNAGEGR